jgi:xyloglucan-specific exo-beta-1,4-glucanase
VTYSADADTVVWSTSSKGVLRSQNQATFAAVSSLPSGALIVSDKRKNAYFYGGSGGAFYVSSDTGATFAKGGALGAATSIRDIAVHPTTAGEVWVSTDVGLFKSTDFGATFAQPGTGLTDTQQIALGLGSGSTWNVYAFGSGASGKKLYGSADSGATWTDIQRSQGLGSISSNRLAGSANKPNQVYVGTNGRGVFYASGIITGGAGGGTSSTTSVKPSSTASTVKPSSTVVSTTSKPSATTTSTTVKSTSTTLLTTTVRSSSTSKTSSASPTPTAVARHWEQCGGIGWRGPTACATGFTCQKQNDYYSQCL